MTQIKDKQKKRNFIDSAIRPLLDKGKPTVRWGRKATGQKFLIAGLPKEGKSVGMGPCFLSRRDPMPRVYSSHFIHRTLASLSVWCCLFSFPNVVQSANTNSVTLQWAANSESDLAGYKVYQGTTAGVYGQAIEVGNVTTYTKSNLQAGLTYYFAITAYDLSGNESYPSTEVSKYFEDSSLDLTPPSISLTSPTNTTALSGTVTINATATDNVGVAGVQFQLNGSKLGAEDTTSPFSLSWDTRGVVPGSYTLSAIARDAAGNTASSAPVAISISSPPSTLTVSIAGSGSVGSSPNGISCTSGTCSASYETGSAITLTAKANKKWTFSGWSGACSGTGECVVQLSANQLVGATFSQNGNGRRNKR